MTHRQQPPGRESLALYSAAVTRELDRVLIEKYQIPGYTLMCRAGAAAYAELKRRWPDARHIHIVCGTGNNAGDGFVFARLARAGGLTVAVWQVGDPGRISGDARTAHDDLAAIGVLPQAYRDGSLDGADVVVDALLGTGVARELSGAFARVVTAINALQARVLALDIPSGLDADTGAEHGVAVRADCTVTFIARKAGLYTGRGPVCCGAILLDRLGAPPGAFDTCPARARLLHAVEPLAPRARDAHKGNSGHVLIVGGNFGFAGAARLAGEAALRCGAGLVSVATRPEHIAAVVAGRPELMVHGVRGPDDLEAMLGRASVVAIGPGLGGDAWAQSLFARARDAGLPAVVDADALHLLSVHGWRGDRLVLTPHPGEAARMLGVSTRELQADRLAGARELAERFSATVVLKGAGTVIDDPRHGAWICAAGNPGLAVGGSGDVLTGVVAALLAQGLAQAEAATRGVVLHAVAADLAARCGERGMLPSDLLPELRRLINAVAESDCRA